MSEATLDRIELGGRLTIAGRQVVRPRPVSGDAPPRSPDRLFRRCWAIGSLALGLTLPDRAGAEATFDCVLDPAMLVDVGSQVVGVLDQVTVDRGEVVKKGQILAQIASEVEAATVELSRVQAGNDAEVEAQEARVELSRKRLERADKLASGVVVAQQRMDELQAEVKVGERELQQARLRKTLAGLEMVRAEAALDQRTARSPIDGIVTQRHLFPGEKVHQEARIVTLVQLDPLYVETFLPVRLYHKVQEGMTGVVHPDEPVGGEYTARVKTVDRVFDAASGTFGVRLDLPNPHQTLPAGHRCRVTFNFNVTN